MSDVGRRGRYAKACGTFSWHRTTGHFDQTVDAVMAVADAEQERIWEGADPTPVPEGRWPLPGQVWHQLLTMDPTDRSDYLFKIFDALSVRDRLERALDEAHVEYARRTEEQVERFHRSVEREEALRARLAELEGESGE